MMDGRGATWRACLLLSLGSGGCDNVFRIDHLRAPDDGALDGVLRFDAASTDTPADAQASTDAATACAAPILYEPFGALGPCGYLGMVYTSSTAIVQANGVITMTPSDVAGAVGGCRTSQDSRAFGTGVTAIVNETTTGSGAYTNLLVRNTNMQIQVSGGKLHFQNTANVDAGSVDYSPQMTWWRIRPSGGTMIIGEYSTDAGASWIYLGAVNATLPSTIGVEITVGSTDGGNVGHGVFDQVMICP